MSEKFKGGELPRPPSASGILIGGNVTLEEHIFLEEAKELGEELTPDNVKPYHKTKMKYKEHKESNNPGRILTRREINEEQWERIIMSQTTIDGAIIGALLSGREMSGTELRDAVLQAIPGSTPKQYSTRSTYIFHKTDFGRFIKSRRSAKGRMFKLVTAALDCTVEDLIPFIYKTQVDERTAILNKHIALQPFLQENDSEEIEENTESEKQIKPEEPKIEPKDVNVEDSEIVKDTEVSVNNAIKNAITNVSNSLGINVTVNGKVEIVFKWGD